MAIGNEMELLIVRQLRRQNYLKFSVPNGLVAFLLNCILQMHSVCAVQKDLPSRTFQVKVQPERIFG